MTVKSVRRRVSGALRRASIGRRLLANSLRRGQAMVEFALIASVALVVLLVGIQFALIGQAALAVSQGSYYAARYAAVQTTVAQGCTSNCDITSQVQNQMSPTITVPSGALNVTFSDVNPADPTCTTTPRGFGCKIQVVVAYNATSKVVLANPFFGISFPTQLNSTTQMMTE
jgi:Flp pilus assembly protein TadG